jgi:hypothetical protein
MIAIFAVIRSLLAKIHIFELFDWLKFFEGNSQYNPKNKALRLVENDHE